MTLCTTLLITTSVVCLFMAASFHASGVRAAHTHVREKRQTFDFSNNNNNNNNNNTNDNVNNNKNDNNTDTTNVAPDTDTTGESQPSSSAGTDANNGGIEGGEDGGGLAFDFENTNPDWDEAEKASVLDQGGDGGDGAEGMPDIDPFQAMFGPPQASDEGSDNKVDCRIECILPCLAAENCDSVPQCAGINACSGGNVDGTGSGNTIVPPTENSEVRPTANKADPSRCAEVCFNHCLTEGDCSSNSECKNYQCGGVPDNKQWNPRNETLRPIEERRCKNHSNYVCVHGICTDGVHCDCDEGWFDVVCLKPCTLKCENGGNCFLSHGAEVNVPWQEITEDDMACNCQYAFTGDLCENRIITEAEKADAKVRKMAIILGCCMLVVLTTSIIIPIVLWKKRVIFVMRVVYFFKMWEDNDGKIYDAYISAGSTGVSMRFVKEILCPRLENQGFQLFIPSRDQLSGDVISEKILTAIKQSRRTIMVVTPDYLRNEWSQFEVLIAQVETIKLQQRIIPIILEDVSQEIPHMRKNLKHILDSVKCLKVPSCNSTSLSDDELQISNRKYSKFWRRLELTMPKRRKLAISDKSGDDVQSDLTVELDINSLKDFRDVHISQYETNGFSDMYLSNNADSSDTSDSKKKYGTMINSKINPLSIYQIDSHAQGIDPSKYEQCFSLNGL